MNEKRCLSIVASSAFLSLVLIFGGSLVSLGKANLPEPTSTPIVTLFHNCLGSFWVDSPSNGSYSSNSTLNLEVEGAVMMGSNCQLNMSYSLDSGAKIVLPVNLTWEQDHFMVASFDGTATLTKLSDGNHSVTVYIELDEYNVGEAGTFYPKYVDSESSLVNFTIDSVPQPTATIIPYSSPSPKIKPTSPRQQTGFLVTNLPVEYGYAIAAAVIAVVAIAAVTLRKRRTRKKADL